MASTGEIAKRYSTTSATSDQTEYRGRSVDRSIRRTNSLLEPAKQFDRFERYSPRRSISLLDDHEEHGLLPPLPKHIMTLGRKYKESIAKSNASVVVGNARRDNFLGYRTTDKIQEEPVDDTVYSACKEEDIDADNNAENGSLSETMSISVCNSNANLIDTTTISSVSAKSCETSPTESSSNLGDYSKSFSVSKSDVASRSFETRLLAAENLIKESKLKNFTPQKFNPNLISNYKDMDKCDKEALITTTAAEQSVNSVASKRRSCIPSLRLRSDSLTRESSVSSDRRKSFAGSPDALTGATQERSILSKFFRGAGNNKDEPKDNKNQKAKQHRISRFLRPDFFDTPREESQYVKEKEAQKAAENERRKSRFMRRKSESKQRKEEGKEERICKEQKDEINVLQKDKLEAIASSDDRFRNEEKERAKIEQQDSKSSFLHLLEKKLERLRSNDEMVTTTKQPTMNGSGPVAAGEWKECRLRENSAPPVECLSPTAAESSSLKRALSVEDLSLGKDKVKSALKTAGRVTSVLGIFKSADAKRNANGNRAQNTIVSKLKKSPPKFAKAESEENAAATTKIPTKFAGKSMKNKLPESKKSPEKIVNEYKKSPPKEKPKELVSKEKKSLTAKQSKEIKKVPEKIAPSDSSSSSSAEKMKLEKAELPRKLSDDSESLQTGNRHSESIMSSEDKKLMKAKKNIGSLSKNESVARIDKDEDVDKSTKKPMKLKEAADKDEINGAKKKKKIVRVVRKVVKKSSDSSESKSDEKEKTRSSLLKKKIMTTKKEKSPEGMNIVSAPNSIRGNNIGDQTLSVKSLSKQMELNVPPSRETLSAKFGYPECFAQNINTASKSDIVASHTSSNKSNAKMTVIDIPQMNSVPQNASSFAFQNYSAESIQNSSGSMTRNASNSNVCQTKVSEQYRPSRTGLKLDLSKIPQHTFKHTTPKRDSPKSDSPKANSTACVGPSKTDIPLSESSADKLMECLSKMTHHANITGNKIIIDKPLRAKDVAELKREVTECARIIENHIESRNDRASPQTVIESIVDSGEPTDIENQLREIPSDSSREMNETDNVKVAKEPVEVSEMSDISEMFSPEEPESFDSWSIYSADLNYNRGDLHSPTSPSYSLFARGDSSESVIDRIRRRSFYSRFNDRKRPSLTAPPPGVSSVTLPKRSSFNSSREWARNRLYGYGISRTR